MKPLSGIITAIITPFKNNKIDFGSLKKLLHHQLENGVQGFVVSGTTGESPTLEAEEVEALYRFVRKNSAKDTAVIVGTGSNCTQTTIDNTSRAEAWGADAALVVVPYYNKPPQRGLVAHFTTVAQNTSLPLLLYNVPGRTVAALSLDSVAELSKVINIVGIKEASGNIQFAKDIRAKCGEDFILLSGDDGTYAEFLSAGGDGVISVLSHVIPKQMRAYADRIFSGDTAAANEFKQYLPLTDLLFCEANPIPVKAAVKMMSLIAEDELRLPLVSMEDGLKEKLRNEMQKMRVV